MRLPARLARAADGTAAIEFALLMPAFLMMFMGVVEFGRLYWTQSTLQQAVEAAARCASFNTSTCDTSDHTKSYAVKAMVGMTVSSSIFTATMYSSASPTYCDSGQTVPGYEVSASLPFTFIVRGLFPWRLTLTAQSCYPAQTQ